MNDERVKEGVEHLQAAALELIAAARSFLDVAEELVKDPAEVVAMASAVAHLAGAMPGREPRPEHESRVERIRVV